MNADELKAQLIIDESLKLKPYLDTVKKTTIGIGRNLDDVGISKDEALYLLDNDIKRTCIQLDTNLPWWRNMSDRRMQGLCNMAFNLGIGKLLEFKTTLAYLEVGRYAEAADAALDSKWAKQVGKRAERIADMIRIG